MAANGEDSSHNDPIQRAMGAFGKWHVFICSVIFLLKFPVAWHQMSIIFLAPPLNFSCANNTIPACSGECVEYNYDRSIFTETIKTTWNLVCGEEHWSNISQMIFMAGILIGNVLFGTLSDKFGRRIPLVAAVFMQLICGVCTAITPWFWLFCVLRFVTAVATGGTMTTSFVLVMEITGVRWRELILVLYQIPFNLGHLTLAGFAYFIRDWHYLQFALSIPSVVLISYYWLVPESPRWLFTVGRVEEASSQLEKAARANNLPTENIHTELVALKKSTPDHEENTSKGNIWDLFRTPNMRAKTIYMCFNWFVCGLTFFGVAQYVGHAGGDIFTNVAISAALELPGTVLCIYTMKRFGRKKTLIFSNCLAGLSMLVIAFIPSGQNLIIVSCASIGIVGMSISFPTVYLYAGELFPTVVRNIGVGTASMIARIGSMIAPFIAGLSATCHWLPPVIFGVTPLIGAILNFATTFYLFSVIFQAQNAIYGAPYDLSDENSIIVIPLKSSDEQVTKINSFKIDGETALRQVFTQVSAEKILRTLSKIQEFDILVEGLDAITLGDVYKAAFPRGLLHSIEEKFLRSPKSEHTAQPEKIETSTDKSVEIPYDEVYEDDIERENLKEEAITDDYIYDQPVEDRFSGEREYVTKALDDIESDETQDSKNKNFVTDGEVIAVTERNKEHSRYGANFRKWINKFLAG
ncbi:Organic cation transporter protein [Pseudolycoriella hygida]|uniref:Organic cation transporter protein n=1 Tax=Pseudolycoriella hygida TaxID=35572 RepID=A0A9Q0N9Q5_9DIPT|nr:Organic cation transporter protein [Pseudolycoriella hygida]